MIQHYQKKHIIWSIIKKFSNLNASIIILLLIALISILGTIIEQDQNLDYYKLHYPLNSSKTLINWKTITVLGLNNIYTNWWFILLLCLFFCTLIACTFSRQIPGLKNARTWKFISYSEIDQNQIINTINNRKTLSNIIYELNIKNYYTFHKKNHTYGYKGIIGRIAPILVHISIVLTLTGSIVGLVSGFTAQQMIPNSEVFHIQNIIKSGWISYLPNNVIGKIDNFTIRYNEDSSIKQFYSNIYLFNNKGQYLTRQSISVNHPLFFKNLTFYQTDWKIHSLRLKIKDQHYIQEKLVKIKNKNTSLWICTLPLNKKNNISLVVTNLENRIFIYNELGELIHKVRINEKFYINNTNIEIQEIMSQTGIQIKTDPGISYVYSSFLILIISIVMSYLSYSQVWIYNNRKENKIHIKGKTNRSKLIFEEEITYLQQSIIKYL